MKWFWSLLTGFLVALAVFAIYRFFSDDGLRTRSNRAEDSSVESSDKVEEGETGSASPDSQPGVPDWMLGSVPRRSAPAMTKRADGLPLALNNLETLTRGRDIATANTLELKQYLLKLRAAMLEMSLEEQKALANYFRNAEDHTLKYFLLIAFRSWGGGPYVEAVGEYYQVDPDAVGEALQHLSGRSPLASGVFAELIRNEFDTQRRLKLIARAGALGVPAARDLVHEMFAKGKGNPERRLAVPALVKQGNAESLQQVRDLINGDYEAAKYHLTEAEPQHEALRDLRAHGVLALLQSGSTEDVDALIARAKNNEDDDAVSQYVENFFMVVHRPQWVGDSVDYMMQRGSVNKSMIAYLSRQAQAKDISTMQRLLSLEMSARERTAIERVINTLN